MQLTRFDHWLREKFIYQTHIYAMRVPEAALPSGVLIEELEPSPSRKYRFRFVTNSADDAEAVLEVLKERNQMFATRIVETEPWFKPIIAPAGKSFFFRLVWTGIGLGLLMVALVTVGLVLANEELRTQLMDALRLFTQ